MEEYVADYKYECTGGCFVEEGSSFAMLNDRYMVVSVYSQIYILDTTTLTPVKSFHCETNSLISSLECVVVGDREKSLSQLDGYIAVGQTNGLVRIMDLEGEELALYREHRKRVGRMAVEGGVVFSLSSDRIALFDIRAESTVISVPLECTPTSLSIVKGRVYIGCDRGTIYSYSVEELKSGVVFQEIESLKSGDVLGVLDVQGDLYKFQSGHVAGPEGSVELPESMKIKNAFSDGSLCLVRDTKNRLFTVEIKNKKMEIVSRLRMDPGAIFVGLFCGRVVVGYKSNALYFYKTLSKEPRVLEGNRKDLKGISLGEKMVVGITEEGCWILAGEECLGRSPRTPVPRMLFVEHGLCSLAFSRSRIYVGNEDGSLSVWSPQGNQLLTRKVTDGRINSLSASEGLVALTSGREAVLLDESLVPVEKFVYDDETLFARLSPNKELLCTSLVNCTVRVSKVSGDHLLTLYGHSMPVSAMEISGDSGTLFSLGLDKLVKIWGLRHGECRRTVNPLSPIGIALSENLLLVNTLQGLAYYHSESYRKMKFVPYANNHPRSTRMNIGPGMIVATGDAALCVREFSLALFRAGEYGVIPEEEEEMARARTEVAEIENEKGIVRVDTITEIEEMLSSRDYLSSHREFYRKMASLPRSDVNKAIDLMNAETKARAIAVTREILKGEYNPVIIGWILSRLMERFDHTVQYSEILREAPEVCRRLKEEIDLMAVNRYALMFQVMDAEASLEEAPGP
jgi:WD40 repeat protein